MKKVILTKGLPASGKSSWAEETVHRFPNSYKIVCKDDLRKMLDSSLHSKDSEQFVLQIRDNIIVESLLAGKHVIVADTNFASEHEDRIRNLVQKFNKDHNDSVQVEIKFFDVPVEECIKRDLKRPNSVGAKVIRQMYDQYLAPKIEPMQQDEKLPKVILVDIDGTVAEKGDRNPFDWKNVGLDKPKKHVINIVRSLKKDGYGIIFFSGRDAVCDSETREWLKDHFLFPENEWQLYMRPQKDQRKDSIVKKEMFDKYIRGKYYVEAVLDDRDHVVFMWRKELGLTCMQVAYGNF